MIGARVASMLLCTVHVAAAQQEPPSPPPSPPPPSPPPSPPPWAGHATKFDCSDSDDMCIRYERVSKCLGTDQAERQGLCKFLAKPFEKIIRYWIELPDSLTCEDVVEHNMDGIKDKLADKYGWSESFKETCRLEGKCESWIGFQNGLVVGGTPSRSAKRLSDPNALVVTVTRTNDSTEFVQCVNFGDVTGKGCPRGCRGPRDNELQTGVDNGVWNIDVGQRRILRVAGDFGWEQNLFNKQKNTQIRGNTATLKNTNLVPDKQGVHTDNAMVWNIKVRPGTNYTVRLIVGDMEAKTRTQGCSLMGNPLLDADENPLPNELLKGQEAMAVYTGLAPNNMITITGKAPQCSNFNRISIVDSESDQSLDDNTRCGNGGDVVTMAPTASPISSTQSPTSTTPSPTSSTPAPSSTTPSPTSSTPAPTSTTPSPTSSTPSPTGTATPPPTSSTPSPSSSTPSPSSSTPSPSASTPSPSASTPSPSASTPSPSSSTPSPTLSTAAPTSTTPSPTLSTAAPTSTTASPTEKPLQTCESLQFDKRDWLGRKERFCQGSQVEDQCMFYATHSNCDNWCAARGVECVKAIDEPKHGRPCEMNLNKDVHCSKKMKSVNCICGPFAPLATPPPTSSTPSPTAASTPTPSGNTPSPSSSTPSPTASTPSPTASTPAPSASTPAPSASTPAPSAPLTQPSCTSWALEGYQKLCEETGNTCTFHHRGPPAMRCSDFCESKGWRCVKTIDDVRGRECTQQNREERCDRRFRSMNCVCKPR